MNFAYTILYVQDVSASVMFYEQAFGLTRRFVHDSGEYAEMETGTTTLSFASNELAISNLPDGFQQNSLSNPPAGIEVAFTTDDVQAAFERAVEAGALGVSPPATKPWGQQVSYVRDIDGVLVEIASPMSG